MDHSMMDHSMHSSMDMDMPGHGHMGNSCKMSMLLTWEYEDYCILTKSWHMKNKQDLVLSIIFTILLGIGYEFFKKISNNYLIKIRPKMLDSTASLPYNAGRSGKNLSKFKIMNSLVYGIKIFLSFLLMLIFMSFNYWIMISLCVGSLIGFYLFNQHDQLENDSLLCH